MRLFLLPGDKTIHLRNVVIFAFIFIIFLNLTSAPVSFSQAGNKSKINCNCVIFRLDDIQDYFLNQIQLTLMNLFLEKNQSLSLGLILNHFGNDSSILNAVHDGFDAGKFELVSHGWNHENFALLSKHDQIDLLNKSNEKMQQLFGIPSSIFMPPEFKFNNATLDAMRQLGIKIITSDLDFYSDTNQSYLVTNITDSKYTQNDNIIHIPNTVGYSGKSKPQPEWKPLPVEQLLMLIDKSISTYGYAVVTLHPQEFATSQNGELTNAVNVTKLNDLEKLIGTINDNNLLITSFNKLVNMPSNSVVLPTNYIV